MGSQRPVAPVRSAPAEAAPGGPWIHRREKIPCAINPGDRALPRVEGSHSAPNLLTAPEGTLRGGHRKRRSAVRPR